MFSKLMLDLAKPILRRMPCGAGRLYRLLGGDRASSTWTTAGTRQFRDPASGCQMTLDLNCYCERETYYLGRFADDDEQPALIEHLLRPGDTYVDVGANIGMLALHAAAVVGEGGHVLAFEPNPEPRRRLESFVQTNGLAQVKVFSVALSDRKGRSIFRVPGPSVVGTLRPVGDSAAPSFEVAVAILDDYIDAIPDNRHVLVKVDAEGYDLNVLKGARRLLSRPALQVVAEVNDSCLRQLNQSAAEMLEYMRDLGYFAFCPLMQRRFLTRHLVLKPLILPGPHHWFNALFTRDPKAVAGALGPRLQRAEHLHA